MFAIFKKELKSYFINAIGYVYVGIFLAISALLCCYTTLASRTFSTDLYFNFMIFSFIILIPLLTMKLFSEEKKLRTEQLLMTAPVSIWGMVMGKFLAAMALFGGTVLVSCVNFIPLFIYGSVERGSTDYASSHIGPVFGEIVACLLGLFLIGCAFLAIGLFISSLTENQLAAAVITVAIILAMLLLEILNSFIDVYAVRVVISWVCMMSRYTAFMSGMLDYSAILYYLSITGVFLLLTVRVYDKRRWG